MFNDVGKEIKRWAQILVILLTIPSVGVGISVWAMLGDEGVAFAGFLAFVIIVLIGFFLARLSAITLYAFGELVDNVYQINRKIETHSIIKPAAPKVTPTPPPTPQTSYPTGEQWRCSTCGHINEGSSLTCHKCSNVR